MEQLDALQSLDQLAPLTATKEHLPADIINILELLGKADNIPFNQLYNLTEDCADRYYMKVIKTLTHLLKNSFHDRQLVLVSSARVLKFLEPNAARQAKLWKVLSNYHHLPDHFHDLKTTLQAEFNLLKKATSKNIENIQGAVQSQQAYTTALCGHINSLYTKLAQCGRQVQTHCLYPHPQSDVVQLNAPDYDLDIDGQPDPVIDIQSPNAKRLKKISCQILLIQNNTQPFSWIPIGLSLSPHQFWMILTTQGTKTMNTQGKSTPVITVPSWKTSQN